MRIVSGEFRGKALVAPEGSATRPTSDRARQAVFNILEHAAWGPELREARVIDLFAGSGALGFEALSRGAAFCLFVETDEDARGAIRENVDNMGLFGRTRVHRRDATDLGVKPGGDGPAFSIAFLDPPYGKGLGETALARLAEGGFRGGGFREAGRARLWRRARAFPEVPGLALPVPRPATGARNELPALYRGAVVELGP
jgi:16S rRNA (guanine966-N2)-methyltransferase